MCATITGSNSSCTFSLYWSGTSHNLSSQDIDAIAVDSGAIAASSLVDVTNYADSEDDYTEEVDEAGEPNTEESEGNEDEHSSSQDNLNESRYITGANIMTDGGMTIQLINQARYASKPLDGTLKTE